MNFFIQIILKFLFVALLVNEVITTCPAGGGITPPTKINSTCVLVQGSCFITSGVGTYGNIIFCNGQSIVLSPSGFLVIGDICLSGTITSTVTTSPTISACLAATSYYSFSGGQCTNTASISQKCIPVTGK
ncbi:hypothetical protein ACQ4LE_006121 [Meloidogyne hapla]